MVVQPRFEGELIILLSDLVLCQTVFTIGNAPVAFNWNLTPLSPCHVLLY